MLPKKIFTFPATIYCMEEYVRVKWLPEPVGLGPTPNFVTQLDVTEWLPPIFENATTWICLTVLSGGICVAISCFVLIIRNRIVVVIAIMEESSK